MRQLAFVFVSFAASLVACTASDGTGSAPDAAADAAASADAAVADLASPAACDGPNEGATVTSGACAWIKPVCCDHPACLTCEGLAEGPCKATAGCIPYYGKRVDSGAKGCVFTACVTENCRLASGEDESAYAYDSAHPDGCYFVGMPPPTGWNFMTVASQFLGTPCEGVPIVSEELCAP